MSDALNWFARALLSASGAMLLLALTVWLVIHLFRPRSPRLEQQLWLLVLAQGLMLLPLTIRLPVTRPVVPAAPQEAQIVFNSNPAGSVAPLPIPEESILPPLSSELMTADPVTTAAVAPRSWKNLMLPLLPAFGVLVWLGGIVFLFTRWVLAYLAFVRRLFRSRAASAEHVAEWEQVLRDRGIKRQVPLLLSDDLGPALVLTAAGSRIVVPAAVWNAITQSERIRVLRHEAEHLRRHDVWWSLLARLLSLLHWFNPVAWWAARRFEQQAEFACDAAAAHQDRVSFAEVLLKLGRPLQASPVAVQAVRSSLLFARIQRLLTPTPQPRLSAILLPALSVIAVTGVLGVRVQFKNRALQAQDILSKLEHLTPGVISQLGDPAFKFSDTPLDYAYSRDGQTIAVAVVNSSSPHVILMDAETGFSRKILYCDRASHESVWCLNYSPDGRFLAAGDHSGRLTVWSMPDDKIVHQAEQHKGTLRKVAFSADSRFLATAGTDGWVVIQRSDEFQVVQRLQIAVQASEVGGFTVAPGQETNFALSPDGGVIATAINSSTLVEIWDTNTGKHLRTIDASVGSKDATPAPLSQFSQISSLQILADGQTLMIGGHQFMSRPMSEIPGRNRNINLSHVSLWNLTTGERLRDFNAEEKVGYGFATVSADDRRIAIVDKGALHLQSLDDGSVLREIPMPGLWGGNTPEFSPDGRHVAVAWQDQLTVFDVATGKQLHPASNAERGPLQSAHWSPDGRRISTGHGDGVSRLWDVSSSNVIWEETPLASQISSGDPLSVKFTGMTRDHQKLVTAGSTSSLLGESAGMVAISNPAAGTRLQTLKTRRGIVSGALSPDGHTILVATSHGGADDTHLVGFDIQTGTRLFSVPAEEQKAGLWQVNAMQFSPDSKSFWVATKKYEIRQYAATSGELLQEHVVDIEAVAEQLPAIGISYPLAWAGTFSHDCKFLVASSLQHVDILNTTTGERQLRIRPPKLQHPSGLGMGYRVAVSPDDKLIVTSLPEGSASVVIKTKDQRTYKVDHLSLSDISSDHTLHFHDAVTGDEIGSLTPDDSVNEIEFSPDGKRLLTGFSKGHVQVWDLVQTGILK